MNLGFVFWVETFGFVLTLVCIYMNTKLDSRAWILALISIVIYFFLFWQQNLYADMLLQVYFFVFSIIGLLKWDKDRHINQTLTQKLMPKQILYLVPITGTIFLVLYFLLSQFSSAEQVTWDSINTSISIVAQILLIKKYIENWILWILADISYAILYFYKNLYVTSLLYVLLTFLAVYGYFQWRKYLILKNDS